MVGRGLLGLLGPLGLLQLPTPFAVIERSASFASSTSLCFLQRAQSSSGASRYSPPLPPSPPLSLFTSHASFSSFSSRRCKQASKANTHLQELLRRPDPAGASLLASEECVPSFLPRYNLKGPGSFMNIHRVGAGSSERRGSRALMQPEINKGADWRWEVAGTGRSMGRELAELRADGRISSLLLSSSSSSSSALWSSSSLFLS